MRITGLFSALVVGSAVVAALPSSLEARDDYTQTFSDLSGAIQAGDYITYSLVDTADGESKNS